MTRTTTLYFKLIGNTTTEEECVQLIHDMLYDPKVSPIEYIMLKHAAIGLMEFREYYNGGGIK